MVDLKTVAPKEQISGNFATFTGFDTPGNTPDLKRIDFIMAGSNGGWQVLLNTCFIYFFLSLIPTYREVGKYKVVENLYDDGLYLSDHRPVVAEITVKPGSFGA